MSIEMHLLKGSIKHQRKHTYYVNVILTFSGVLDAIQGHIAFHHANTTESKQQSIGGRPELFVHQ